MRLAQLARELDIPKNTIIRFLSSKRNISMETHGNTKIENDLVLAVRDHFAKQDKALKIPKNVDGDPKEQKEDNKAQIIEEEKNDDKVNNESKEKRTEEVIRPKKVKLQGIKVVGKIDLPEVADKEKPQEKENTDTEKKETTPSNKYKKARTPNRRPRGNRRELSPEEKKRREEKELKRKKQQQAKKLKEKKKKHYAAKLKSREADIARKKKKKKKFKSEHLQTKNEKPVVTHKNPFRRLWAWLNGEYDRI